MGLSVLIVDDSSLTRKRIKRIIEMTDFEVDEFLEAGTGAEALKVLDESTVDLVLSDLNMPEMGGAEMVYKMKSAEATRSIPVVIVSTESKTTRIKELLSEGVKDYLHKPFTPEEFKGMIHSLWTTSVEETGDLLIKALSQALETMAFLTVLPPDDDLQSPTKTILAQISFEGPKSGTIQILAGFDFCKVLAENLGGVSSVDDKTCCDALKELSNVACGLFLPKVTSSTADVFDVTVPTVATCDDSSQWQELTADPNSSVSNIEGHLVAARLVIEDE